MDIKAEIFAMKIKIAQNEQELDQMEQELFKDQSRLGSLIAIVSYEAGTPQ